MSQRVLERYTTICLLLDLVGVAAALALATALRYAVPAGRPLIPERNYLSVGLFPLALACWALAA
ncbi:MAG TPA: hypothetical protein VFW96_14685, partial [Thermomicrobiales bacterium]|nr:hypothetical protein [Thermomicrobiales bacterium]